MSQTAGRKTPTPEPPTPSLPSQLNGLLREMVGLRQAISNLTLQIETLAAALPGDRQDAGRRDPGDGVPPGVAVQTPAPLSDDDRKTLRRLKRLPRS